MPDQQTESTPTTQPWGHRAKQAAKRGSKKLTLWGLALIGLVVIIIGGWIYFNYWKNGLRQEGRQAADNVWAACVDSLEDCPDADIRQNLTEFSSAGYDAGRQTMEEEIVACLTDRAGVGCPTNVQDALDLLLRDAATSARSQTLSESRLEIQVETYNQLALYLAGEVTEDELPSAALVVLRELGRQ